MIIHRLAKNDSDALHVANAMEESGYQVIYIGSNPDGFHVWARGSDDPVDLETLDYFIKKREEKAMDEKVGRQR